MAVYAFAVGVTNGVVSRRGPAGLAVHRSLDASPTAAQSAHGGGAAIRSRRRDRRVDRQLLAGTQHRAGLTAEAEKTLAQVNAIAANGYVPDLFLAVAHLWIRGPDAAMPFLQRAYDRRDAYVVIIKFTPWFDDMRGHAGCQEIVRRMKYTP